MLITAFCPSRRVPKITVYQIRNEQIYLFAHWFWKYKPVATAFQTSASRAVVLPRIKCLMNKKYRLNDSSVWCPELRCRWERREEKERKKEERREEETLTFSQCFHGFSTRLNNVYTLQQMPEVNRRRASAVLPKTKQLSSKPLQHPPWASPVALKGTRFQSGTSKPQVLHHPHYYHTHTRHHAAESARLFTATAWCTILYRRSAESFSKQRTKSSICLREMNPVSANLTTSSPHWHVMFFLRTSKVTAYSSFLKDVVKDRTATFSSFCCFSAVRAALLTNPSQPLIQLLLDRARKRPAHLFPQSLENCSTGKACQDILKTFERCIL